MKKRIVLLLAMVSTVHTSLAQWNGHTSASDLTTPINRTGLIAIDGYSTAQIRLNSQGTYYGKIGNPAAQVWSLGWGGAGSDINPVLSWTATGNVGIGEVNPGHKLDIINLSTEPQNLFRVRVNGAPDDYLKIINATGAANQFIPNLYGYHTSDNRQALYITGAIGAMNDVGTEPIMVFDSRISTAPSSNRQLFAWDSYGSRKMTMTASGNVGIGTAYPSTTSRLHLFHPSSSTWLNIDKPNSSTEGGLMLSNNTNVMFYVWSDNDDGDALKIEATGLSGETDAAPRMEFPRNNKNIYMAESGGNVGIGTTNPGGNKLAVEGKIGAREVNVTLTSPWPDYVLTKDYNLPSLNLVEDYIAKHGHLPDVPTASEVEDAGINIGQMNTVLLKKIEELTLYVIDQNKRIDAQEKINQKLITEINALKNEK